MADPTQTNTEEQRLLDSIMHEVHERGPHYKEDNIPSEWVSAQIAKENKMREGLTSATDGLSDEQSAQVLKQVLIRLNPNLEIDR